MFENILTCIKENNHKELKNFIDKDFTCFNFIYSNIDISLKKNKIFLKDVFSNMSFLDKSSFFKKLNDETNSIHLEKFKLIINDFYNSDDKSNINNGFLEAFIIKCCLKTKKAEIIENWLNNESFLFKNIKSYNSVLMFRDLFIYCCNNSNYNNNNLASKLFVDKMFENDLVPTFLIHEGLSCIEDYDFFKHIYVKLNKTQQRKYLNSIDDFYFKKRVCLFIERINDEQLKINLEQSVEEEINLKNNKTKRKI